MMADLSDPARFAYASLVTLVWKEKYQDDVNEDQDFRDESIRCLLQYLELAKCEPAMQMLLIDENCQSSDPFLQILSEEPDLKADGSLVISNALQWALRKGSYDARIRVVLRALASLFKLSQEHFEMLEDAAIMMRTNPSSEKSPSFSKEEETRRKRKKFKRYGLIGAASVGGGILLGLTGGLVAPLVGASLGALIGFGGAVGTAAGAAVVGSLFGAAGAGVAGYKMKKRVGDVEEFTFVTLPPGEGSRLQVMIAVPGWLPPSDDDDDQAQHDDSENVQDRLMEPLDCLAQAQEQYGLQYETRYLAELGRAMDAVYNMALSLAAAEILKRTVLHSLMAAVALPRAILSLASVIDNPWSVCCRRSAQAGELLALTLMDRTAFGSRPVSLCGISLGARVIFYCLKELQRRGSRGIVEDVVLIGTPVSGNPSEWLPLLEVVAGRLVNAFSTNDWVLKILYRTTSASYNIAGLQPIDIRHGRLINLDLSDTINGHGDYRIKAAECFEAAQLRIVRPSDDDDEVSNDDNSSSSSSLSVDSQAVDDVVQNVHHARLDVMEGDDIRAATIPHSL